ncbi:MAG: ribonuclease H family protein [Clostridioides sp.]|nr:ribonuclease H family protein [Clostridioides sp.]
MAQKKFYAVRKGKKTGIFETWDICKAQVHGFAGAEYKSFKTIDEAKEYIDMGKGKKVDLSENTVEAYVDGSYEHSIKTYGSGVVILQDGEAIAEFSVKGEDENLVSMRNVAGEIGAAEVAMTYCVENNIKNLILYFDYQGIEKWCTGEWKANKKGTQEYKNYYDSVKNKVNIIFTKVKAHSGDKYNDEADRLAKEAVLK